MANLDEGDKQVLNLIQKGDFCKPNITKLARALGLPTTTVHSKLKRLEKESFIKGYQGLLDNKKAGIGQVLFIVMKVKYEAAYAGKKELESFGEKLAKIPEVQEVHSCSGDWDYLLKIKAKDADDYYHIGTEHILPLGGIERMESYISYKQFKENPRIILKV